MKTVGSQSFDQKLKRFFFMHWEKIVLTLAFLGIGGFCWFGYVKPYDKTNPTQLKQNVETAKRYIQAPDSWTQIANYRRADDDAVEAISAEQKIDDQPYQYPGLLGTKAATRGLRTDPEIKKPMNPMARVVTGTILVQRPEDAPGVRRRDWWTELILYRKKNSSVNPEEGDGSGGGEEAGLGRGQRGANVRVNTEKKGEILVVPELMKVELRGLSPSKLGLQTDEHTSLVVSAVAVTGLFPHELQAKEYEKLKDAIKYNPLRDQPYYVYLQVERRKRVNGQESEWEDISKYVTEDLLKNVYAATAPEIVEEPYVDQYLTVKIPPFVWMDYKAFSTAAQTPVIVERADTTSESVAVTSKQGIQLTDFAPRTQEDKPAVVEEIKKLAQYKLIRFFDMSVGANEEVQYRFRVWLADPNNPKKSVYDRIWNRQQIDAATGAGADSGDSEGASGAGGMRGAARGSRQNNKDDKFANAGNPFDLTFMDVDTDVRKRLKEKESQPDFPAPLEFLKDARPSEWSDPTEWIHIPRANSEIVAGRVEPGLQLNINGVVYSDDEPQVNVVVKKWDPALQVQVPASRKVFRGSVMNFRSPAKVVNPIDRQLYDVKRELSEEGTDENGVKFNTNAFVVDMGGGQKMPYSTIDKAYYKPSEILIMNEDGTLQVRNELADRMDYRHGTYAEDELLTDAAPQVEKEEEEQDDEGAGGSGRGGRSGRGRGAR